MKEEYESLGEVQKRAIKQKESRRKAILISMTIVSIVGSLYILFWAKFRIL